MSTVDNFHPQAMDLADMAFRYRRQGEEERAKELFLEAMKLEIQAASLLSLNKEAEPTRSILYRSAASLAYNGGDYETADRLVANGLAGFPPIEIIDELKILYDDINFMRHLSAKGIELGNEQWLMTLAGNAVSHGVTLVENLIMRVDKLSIIFYRTVERLLKLPYRTNGGVSKEIKGYYGLYITAFLPSSFAVAFQLGRPNPQLSLFPDIRPAKPIEPIEIIDEVLKCFEVLEGLEPTMLRERFPDDMYYENFIGLAKQIAPDGDDVQVVGFTTMRQGKEHPVALRKSRQQIRNGVYSTKSSQEGEAGLQLMTYKGTLRYAFSPKKRKFGTVKLIETESGEVLVIKVPISLMKDVVQPFYEERVNVLLYEKDGEKYLEEISADK